MPTEMPEQHDQGISDPAELLAFAGKRLRQWASV